MRDVRKSTTVKGCLQMQCEDRIPIAGVSTPIDRRWAMKSVDGLRYTTIGQSGKATDEALPVNKMEAPSMWDNAY
jgi:hypothetical protein